ncbi:unnamed protein product [Pneumocystis jirovecii]|uniref:Uncharacterized protein n=2 Tax=Pneumocystis jirovecii TaxID=42068 RepID=L0PAV5_PNEJI|nr:uncharacterized protein T551_01685 [Pneumocystis jirovecii RU7]KTW30402.1 hypothetical protein T551_01685 [Pneumocystis jirovecii RU7]CCJ29342.1 unnamed protein product [Pneumocystis jirovecii]
MIRHGNLVTANVTQVLWKRHYCDYKSTLQERYDCYSRWNQWGRWVVLSKLNPRSCTNWSRASQGTRPIRYTGWTVPGFVHQHPPPPPPPPQPYGYPMQPVSSYVPPRTTENHHWPHEEQPVPPYEPPMSSNNYQPSHGLKEK